jgi:hypothetical protein
LEQHQFCNTYYLSGYFNMRPYQLVITSGVLIYLHTLVTSIYYLLPVDDANQKYIPGGCTSRPFGSPCGVLTLCGSTQLCRAEERGRLVREQRRTRGAFPHSVSPCLITRMPCQHRPVRYGQLYVQLSVPPLLRCCEVNRVSFTYVLRIADWFRPLLRMIEFLIDLGLVLLCTVAFLVAAVSLETPVRFQTTTFSEVVYFTLPSFYMTFTSAQAVSVLRVNDVVAHVTLGL